MPDRPESESPTAEIVLYGPDGNTPFVEIVDEVRRWLRRYMQVQQQLMIKADWEGRESRSFIQAYEDLGAVLQRLNELRTTLAERKIERIVRANA